MRLRTELLIAGGATALLIVFAFARGLADRGNVNLDPRASTLVQSPSGWSAVAEIAEATGHSVVRARQSTPIRAGTGTSRTLFATANARFSSSYARELLDASGSDSGVSLLLAGPAAGDVFRCLGYDLDVRILESIRVEDGGGNPVGLRAAIRVGRDTSRTLRERGFDDEVLCPVLPIARVDTLIRAVDGSVVALALVVEGGKNIYLLSDARFLSNQAIKESGAPLALLDVLLTRFDRFVFDEFHHGFGPDGSLLSATLEWSRKSPWGWMVWQLSAVGLLIFLAGAVRFGSTRAAIKRERRSPVEHVKALATALAAARGHDVAIGSMIHGLRRRLTSAGQATGAAKTADWRLWVRALPARMPTPEAQHAAQQLVPFTEPNQPVAAVQQAAHAVEDVWHALHP